LSIIATVLIAWEDQMFACLRSVFVVWMVVSAVGAQGVVVTPMVSAGVHADSSYVLRADGTVWAWGRNDSGQLGAGATSPSPNPTPAQVAGLPPILKIASGGSQGGNPYGGHVAALDTNGNVWTWGANNMSQLGHSASASFTATPAQVPGVTAVDIAVGSWHTLALRADGTLMAWGLNDHGQLGDGTTTTASIPTPVSSLGVVGAIAAGYKFSVAVLTDGTVWAWGQNNLGQLGNAGAGAISTTPVQVSGITMGVEVGAGVYHAACRLADGTIRGWGDNSDGQLGDGTLTNSATPVVTTGVNDAIALDVGSYFTSCVRSDRSALIWGQNHSYQLGNGTTAAVSTPAPLMGVGFLRQVAGGNFHALALGLDGVVWSWGTSGHGQVGIPSGPQPTPLALSTISAGQSPGDPNRVLTLDGADDYVLVNPGPCGRGGLDGLTEFTVEVWARRTASGPCASDKILVIGTDWNPAFGGVYNQVTIHCAGVSVEKGPSGSSCGVGATGVPGVWSDNAWHHIAGVYDGSTLKCFVDGVLQGTATIPACSSITSWGPWNFNHLPIRIGRQADNADYWNGELEEFRIWNQARTEAQIQSTMFDELDDAPGLVSAWHFNGTALDSTGVNHGVPQDGAAFGLYSPVSAPTPPGLSLTFGQDAGCGSALIANSCGQPGATYFTAITIDPMNDGPLAGLGWWGGLWIDYNLWAAQLTLGAEPYVGSLDANGASVWTLPSGTLPPGITFYGVTHTFAPASPGGPAYNTQVSNLANAVTQ